MRPDQNMIALKGSNTEVNHPIFHRNHINRDWGLQNHFHTDQLRRQCVGVSEGLPSNTEICVVSENHTLLDNLPGFV
jgi:hypothetical protein